MTAKDFTLPIDLHREIESMDCISQINSEKIAAFTTAICRLTDDSFIKTLAVQIACISDETMNVVNVAAEYLGANFVDTP